MRPQGTRRERGAYYTPDALARKVASWAVRDPNETILDPAAGKGALLGAAQTRIEELGRSDGDRLYGVELHNRTHRHLTNFGEGLRIPARNLRRGDFFAISDSLPKPDVVLMNPPFVRHHDIPVRAHERMRDTVESLGYPIGGRASSWAYFLLGSARILKPDGRIAAILPLDLLGADYARDVLHFFDDRFERSEITIEGESLFEGLQLRVVLLLAQGFRGTSKLARRSRASAQAVDASPPAITEKVSDSWRCHISTQRPTVDRAVALLNEYGRLNGVSRLDEQATIGIGYVAGDSNFFHLTEAERLALGLGRKEVVRVVRGARSLSGIRFKKGDWEDLLANDSACWLFHPRGKRSEEAVAYLKGSKSKRAQESFKCLIRDPWWKVDIQKKPAAFVIYSGALPRVVANSARAWASNALYTAHTKECRLGSSLAVCSLTSVAQMSIRLAARELGGGLRKLDVRDIQNIRLPDVGPTRVPVSKVDSLIRQGAADQAIRMADQIVLRDALGWSNREVGEFRKLLKGLE